MKILTLRIYNSTPYYDEMLKLHQQYDKNSVYVTASPSVVIPTFDSTTNILTVNGTESLIPGVLRKTLKAIEYCLKNFEFDVLIRSNMSTVLDYDELEKQLETIKRPVYGGHPWNYRITQNIIHTTHFKFISGCCTVMDREVCNYLIHQPEFLNNVYDDVAIGYCLYKRFPITFVRPFVEATQRINTQCFYRFRKDMTRYDNRKEDVQNMKKLYIQF
jgi:hypothetical protein